MPAYPGHAADVNRDLAQALAGKPPGSRERGLSTSAVVEIDPWAAETLRLNRPAWNVIGPAVGTRPPLDGGPGDVRAFKAEEWAGGGVDLFAGGVPCPPFSVAGKQLGADDERDLFPEALRLIRECKPQAVMLENVRGLLDPKFSAYRETINEQLIAMGYVPSWRLLHASHYGVSQLRPRALLVALRPEAAEFFAWPEPRIGAAPMVGELLEELMAERGWRGARAWADGADRIAPTLVGGSKKHGGPDLGPTRARREWLTLGVDGRGLANEAPAADFEGIPRLTVQMAARVQGFDQAWQFAGGKTAQYRQVGNAFPPPVAAAVGGALVRALRMTSDARSAGVAA